MDAFVVEDPSINVFYLRAIISGEKNVSQQLWSFWNFSTPFSSYSLKFLALLLFAPPSNLLSSLYFCLIVPHQWLGKTLGTPSLRWAEGEGCTGFLEAASIGCQILAWWQRCSSLASIAFGWCHLLNRGSRHEEMEGWHYKGYQRCKS